MQLWQLVNRLRGRVSLSDFRGLIDALLNEGIELSTDDLLFLGQRVQGRLGGWVPPVALCSFLARLIASREAMRVLDPMAGSGWLAMGVASNAGAARLTAVSDWQDAAWLTERFPMPRLSLVQDDPGDAGYDAVIAFPPVFGHREERRSPSGQRITDDPGLLQLLDMAERITEDGVIAWVTSPKFSFETRKTSVRQSLGQYGLHLTGLIQMPSGMLAPATPMALEIALVERQQRKGLYVASLPEGDEQQAELVDRLRKREEGPEPTQGRVVDPALFAGIQALEAAERARRIASRAGLRAVDASDVIEAVHRPRRRRDGFEHVDTRENAVYLPQMARTPATTERDDLPDRLQSYLQLIVRPEIAHPAYVAGLLNTPLGHAIRSAASVGATIGRITEDSLRRTMLYLPPLPVQQMAVEALHRLKTLRGEIDQLEFTLWERPTDVSKVADRLGRINREDAEERFEDWIETLPFPLASVLRAYHTQDRTAKDKYARLLHFFEAAAAFYATVHLSALRQNDEVWKELQETLSRLVDPSRGLDWSRPTFGLWQNVNSACSKLARTMLNGSQEQKEQVQSLYAVADERPLELITSKVAVRLFQDANNCRNRWTGHGGAVNEAEAHRRLSEIEQLLAEYRAETGTSFGGIEALVTETMTKHPGPVFRCEARRAMGSHPQFERLLVELQLPPNTGQLCLHHIGHSLALDLLPMVRMREIEQPACFFYNRLQQGTAHFVSYHYGDAEWDDTSGEIDGLIAELSDKPSGIAPSEDNGNG